MRTRDLPSFSLLLLLATYGHGRRYPLPASARITVGSAKDITKELGRQPDPLFGNCSKYHLAKAEVREQFAHYHELTGPEFHDHYDVYPCQIDGTVTVNGKTLEWESNAGDTMSTTYPDGKWKTLGGEHSGDAGE